MSSICNSISELAENAQLACWLFLSECEKLGLKVRITETYRSQQRQNELYAQGRTAPGKVVTWTKKSRHTKRRAWDICQGIKGKEYDTSEGFFERCAEVAKKLGITWGGAWKTPDRPKTILPDTPSDVGKGIRLCVTKRYTPPHCVIAGSSYCWPSYWILPPTFGRVF